MLRGDILFYLLLQAVAQQQGATICNNLAHLLLQAVAQQQGASGTLGMAPPQQQQPPGPQASQAGAPMGGSPLLGQAGSGGLQGMPNGQVRNKTLPALSRLMLPASFVHPDSCTCLAEADA